MNRAFSLVELSIVLVILGLLTGGILAGQSLIRAAELRSVSTQYNQYVTATRTFRDKYMALPGDMNNATRFWGDDNAACADAAIPNGTPGTCNGNGNGQFEAAAAPGGTSEELQYWKQLTLAGLIEGSYTGLAGPTLAIETVIGVNVPRTRLSNGGASVVFIGTLSGNTDLTYFDGNFGNMLQFGTQNPTGRTGYPLIRAEEMWNIDTKMDDGRPAFGFVRGDRTTSGNAPNCPDGNTAATAGYNLTNTGITCRINFITGF